MRFTSKIQLWLPGAVVMRAPTFWDGFLELFGSKPDLRSPELVTTRTMLSIAESLSGSLWNTGITNAVALSVNQVIFFQDSLGRSGDVPLLVSAARQAAVGFAQGFTDLCAVYERHESGLHTVIEARFRARYRPQEPCAVVSLGARIEALRPRPGEARSTSRARVHAIVNDPLAIDRYRQGFSALTGRVEKAMQQGFPEGRLMVDEPLAQVVKASRRTLTTTVNVPREARGLKLRERPKRAHARAHTSGHYHDPSEDWYDDPGYVEAEVDCLDAFAHIASQRHPHCHGIHVIHEDGSPICEADAMLDAAPDLVGIDNVGSVFDCLPGTDLSQVFAAYGYSDPKPTEWSSGASDASGSAGSSDCGSSDCTKDCAGSDCASSDCMSKDCASSDCYSSDCSKDCASSDCVSSDCSKDCASSDCVSSDCSKD